MTVGRGACADLDDEQTARRIKQWCVEAATISESPPSRQMHMALHRRAINPDELLGDDLLVSLRTDLWDDAPA
eukprot:9987857-Karenia_brevis.AAC.1